MNSLPYTEPMPTQCLPFLKWAGGKRKITGLLRDSFPEEFLARDGDFYEPFVGGGALTLALGDGDGIKRFPGSRILINDMNPDLVATYETIRDNLPALIEKLDLIEGEFKPLPMPPSKSNENEAEGDNKIHNRADYFYSVRTQEPTDKLDQAARLIFLNKTCFNGLWRVNSKGKFNVPYGHHKNPSLYDKNNLEECSLRLQGARISNAEFHLAVETAKAGDLVYFDPPYIPLNLTSSFSQYSKNDFGLLEQVKLAETIEELTDRGVFVMLSNSDTPETREIFGTKLQLRRILMSRYISATAANRNPVYEVIGTNFDASHSPKLSSLEVI